MDKPEAMIESYAVKQVIVERILFVARTLPDQDARGRVEELIHLLREIENVQSTKEK